MIIRGAFYTEDERCADWSEVLVINVDTLEVNVEKRPGINVDFSP